MRRSSHSVTELQYHIVLVTKRRKKVITGSVEELLKIECIRMIEHFEGKVIEIATDVDYIHILAELSPKYSITEVVNSLKGVSSRMIRKNFPELDDNKVKKGRFWNPSYYCATTGGVTVETIKKYVESQKGRKPRK